jgi:Replication-relaxation
MSLPAASPLRARRDPRDELDKPDRDYAALQYIMEGYQETQPNVDEAIFPGSSKTPASRGVKRLAAAGYIQIERWNGVGVNLLRGTRRGRDALVARGVDPSRLFVPERPVAVKDLKHHMWINDCRLALRQRGIADVTPCWTLRRKLAELRPPAIPDLLAFPTDAGGAVSGILAVEVDLGTESLKVLIPKLTLLRDLLASWANVEPVVVLVLTVGPRRILAMEKAIADTSHEVGVVVLPLPKATGRAAVLELRALIAKVAGPSEHHAKGVITLERRAGHTD